MNYESTFSTSIQNHFADSYLSVCQDLQIQPLHSLIQSLRTTLEQDSLDLSALNLGGRTAFAVSQALREKAAFNSVDAGDCSLGDEGCAHLLSALKNNPYIHSLDLRGNSIGPEGAKSIADFLRTNTSLNKLGIQWNSVGMWDTGIRAISESLCVNSTLTELDLRNNRIGPQGGVALAMIFKKNTSLLKIDLRWNNLGLIGSQAIADQLKFNYSIASLDLAGNNTPEEILTTIEAILMRNKDNSNFRRDHLSQTELLKAQLTDVQKQHDETIINLHSQFEFVKNESKTQAESMESQIQQLIAALEKKKQENIEVTMKFEQEQRATKLLELQLEEMQNLLKKSEEDSLHMIQNLQEQLSNQKTAMTETDYQHSATISEYERKVALLNQTIASLQHNVQTLNADLLLANQKAQQERQSVKALEDKVIQQQLADKKEKDVSGDFFVVLISKETVQYYENQLVSMKSGFLIKIAHMEDQVKFGETLKSKLEEEVEAKNQELVKANMEYQRKLKELEFKSSEEKSLLEQKLSHLQTSFGELKVTSENQTKEMKQLQFAKDAETANWQSEMRKANQEKSRLQDQIASLTSEIESGKREKEALKATISAHQQNEVKLTKEIETLKHKIHLLEEDLRKKDNDAKIQREEFQGKLTSLESVVSNFVKTSFLEAKRQL